MADTLLDVVKRIARRVKIDPNITVFSDDDETQLLVDMVNDAVAELRERLPKEWIPYLQKNGSITTANGTRLYNVAADALALEIFNWGFRNETESDAKLTPATLEFITETYPNYQDDTGKPEYVYQEDTQLGFYPVPDGIYTLEYLYPEVPARMSSTGATFPYPDSWLTYIEFAVSAEYAAGKGFGNAGIFLTKKEDRYAQIYAELAAKNPGFIH